MNLKSHISIGIIIGLIIGLTIVCLGFVIYAMQTEGKNGKLKFFSLFVVQDNMRKNYDFFFFVYIQCMLLNLYYVEQIR